MATWCERWLRHVSPVMAFGNRGGFQRHRKKQGGSDSQWHGSMLGPGCGSRVDELAHSLPPGSKLNGYSANASVWGRWLYWHERALIRRITGWQTAQHYTCGAEWTVACRIRSNRRRREIRRLFECREAPIVVAWDAGWKPSHPRPTRPCGTRCELDTWPLQPKAPPPASAYFRPPTAKLRVSTSPLVFRLCPSGFPGGGLAGPTADHITRFTGAASWQLICVRISPTGSASDCPPSPYRGGYISRGMVRGELQKQLQGAGRHHSRRMHSRACAALRARVVHASTLAGPSRCLAVAPHRSDARQIRQRTLRGGADERNWETFGADVGKGVRAPCTGSAAV